MAETFNGDVEPMRAIRDLINACEVEFQHDKDVLGRAREGFTALRKLFGDSRPGDEIADAAMMEPWEFTVAFQMTAGALQTVAPELDEKEGALIVFTDKWAHLDALPLKDILDRADAALEGSF